STRSRSLNAALPRRPRRYTRYWVRPLAPVAIDSTSVLWRLSRHASLPGSSSSSRMDHSTGRWTCSLPTRYNYVLLVFRERILPWLPSVQSARTRTCIPTVPRVKRPDGAWPLWGDNPPRLLESGDYHADCSGGSRPGSYYCVGC